MSDRDVARAGSLEPASARTTSLWWLIWILWIPFFIPVLLNFLRTHPAPFRAVLSLSGAALFFGIYLWTTWRCGERVAGAQDRIPRGTLPRWAPVVVMFALSVGLTYWNGSDWGALFIYTCTSAAGWLSLWEATGVITGAVAVEALGLGVQQGNVPGAVNAIAFTLIPAMIVIALMRSVSSAQQVRGAREEMARLEAVTEERLRIARDLHDLLGHNLSVIALKSELARRLLAVAPERAAVEIGDVEAVARNALREVREAVAGYRQPSLSGELAGAREILAAAGIACRMEGDASATAGLSAARDAGLAWVVREGVTNVIRHGHARTCTIRIKRTEDEIVLEIENDIRRASTPPTLSQTEGGAGGHGLRGVAERMEALGGRCEAGPRGDGFRLRASLPLDRARRGGEDAPAPAAPASEEEAWHPSEVTLTRAYEQTEKEQRA
jgi:two-component system sensor histidine kinase DesK